MKRSSASPFLPVIIIALGAAAIVIGAVMVALRERERQRRGISDDLLEDTAEIDATSDDIAAANDAVEADDEPVVQADAPCPEAQGILAAEAAGVRVEAIPDGLLVHVPDMAPAEASAGLPRS